MAVLNARPFLNHPFRLRVTPLKFKVKPLSNSVESLFAVSSGTGRHICEGMLTPGVYEMFVFTVANTTQQAVRVTEHEVRPVMGGEFPELSEVTAVVAFLAHGADGQLEDGRPPEQIIAQGVANLSAIAALPVESIGAQAVVIHFACEPGAQQNQILRQSSDNSTHRLPAATQLQASDADTDETYETEITGNRALSDMEANGTVAWRLWYQFFVLHQKLRMAGWKVHPHKVFSTLLGDIKLPTAAGLRSTIEQYTLQWGWYNYQSPSWDQALAAADAHKLLVREVDGLAAFSSLVLLFRDGVLQSRQILLRKDLSFAEKVFLLLYEIYHAQFDLNGVIQLPPALSNACSISLSPTMIDPANDHNAEMFALVGLFPTAELIWAFRDEIRTNAGFHALLRPSVGVTDETRPRMHNILRATGLDSLSDPPGWDRRLHRRLLAAFRYASAKTQSLANAINRTTFDADTVRLFARELAGAWVICNADGVVELASPAYEALLSPNAPKDLLDLGEQHTAERFKEANDIRKQNKVPIEHFFRFKNEVWRGGGKPLVHLLTWPVVREDVVVGTVVMIHRAGHANHPITPTDSRETRDLAMWVTQTGLRTLTVGAFFLTLAAMASAAFAAKVLSGPLGLLVFVSGALLTIEGVVVLHICRIVNHRVLNGTR